MQKRLLAILFVCMIAGISILNGCRKNNGPAASEKIAGKWTIHNAIGDYTTLGESHKDTTTFTSEDYFQFNADGSLAIKESGGDYSGKWSIVDNKLVVSETGYMDYASGFDIIALTTTDLQLYYVEIDGSSSLKQTLNLKK